MTELETHFIRKHAWIEILEEQKGIADSMRKRILEHYCLRMKFRLTRLKDMAVRKFMERNDYKIITIS